MVLMVHSSRLQRNGFNTISSQSQQRVCSPATSLLTLCMRCRRRQGVTALQGSKDAGGCDLRLECWQAIGSARDDALQFWSCKDG